MKEKRAIYYQDSRGNKPAKTFIDSLGVKAKAKVLARIEYLEKHWHEIRRPLVDIIDTDLYELRVKLSSDNVRILYAYMFENYIVLLHGLQKRTDKIPENDRLKAKKRRLDFQIQYNEGKIKLKRQSN